MFRLVFIILLQYILIAQIGYVFSQNDNKSTVCDCNCNCAVQIEVINGDLDEDVRKQDDVINTTASNIEKESLANGTLKPSSYMEAASNKVSGIHKIQLKNLNVADLEVLCKENVDFEGWLLIQRRQSNSENFERDWRDYKEGFGNLTENFWIGLEKLHVLTSSCEQELYIQMKTHNGSEYYANYSEFLIGDETESYVLKTLGNYSGNAGDALSYHLGNKFSTHDNDNDESARNCAWTYNGGWWFNNCYRGYLNGRYGANLGGVNWHDIEKDVSLVFAQMMIRPTLICCRKIMSSKLNQPA